MGARGELFTTQVHLDNRSYFFNVKENRTGDIFLQIVESKNRDGAEADRHQIAIFAEDMQKFFQGLDKSIEFVEKERKAKQKAAREKRAAKDAKFSKGASGKRVVHLKSEKTPGEAAKKPARLHVVSKKAVETEENNSTEE